MRSTLLLFLLILALITGCDNTEKPFLKVRLSTEGPEAAPFLQFRVPQREKELKDFFASLDAVFGNPRITFLNYTLESYPEFFAPEHRAIPPEILSQPYGIQKIMVWDSLQLPEWGEAVMQVSLQVEEIQSGSRPIDPYYTDFQFRIRTAASPNLLGDKAHSRRIQTLFSDFVRSRLGPPAALDPGPEWAGLEAHYEMQKQAYQQRVKPFLSGKCYPPITASPDKKVFRIQLCEDEAVTDTLFCRVKVLDDDENPLPFTLLNSVNAQYTDTLLILDGISGYVLFCPVPERLERIEIEVSGTASFDLYQRGDFLREGKPFKFRWKPDQYKQWKGKYPGEDSRFEI